MLTPYNYPKFSRHYVAGAFDAPKPQSTVLIGVEAVAVGFGGWWGRFL